MGTKSPGVAAPRVDSAVLSGAKWSRRCVWMTQAVCILGWAVWSGLRSCRPELWCVGRQAWRGINTCLPLSPIGLRLKETFLVTGSQDCTVKLWPLPEAQLPKSTAPDSGPAVLQAQATQRCHDKVTIYGTRLGVWQGPHWYRGSELLSPALVTRTSTVWPLPPMISCWLQAHRTAQPSSGLCHSASCWASSQATGVASGVSSSHPWTRSWPRPQLMAPSSSGHYRTSAASR